MSTLDFSKSPHVRSRLPGLLAAVLLSYGCQQPSLLLLELTALDPIGTQLELELTAGDQTRTLDVSASREKGQLAIELSAAEGGPLHGELRVRAGPLGCLVQSAALDVQAAPRRGQTSRLALTLVPRSGCTLSVTRQGSGTISSPDLADCADPVCTRRILTRDRLTLHAVPQPPADTATWLSPASCKGRQDCELLLDPSRAIQAAVTFSTGPAPADPCLSARVVAVSPAPPVPAATTLTSVYGSRDTALYVGGSQGVLAALSGNSWSTLTPYRGGAPYAGTLRALTGSGSVVWAVGDSDAAFLSMGGAFMDRSPAFGSSFLGASYLSSSEHVVVGTGGLVATTDPVTGAIKERVGPGTLPLRAAFWRNADELWVAGGTEGINGLIYKQTASDTWARVSPAGGNRAIRALQGPTAGPIWAVGERGLVWLSDVNGTTWQAPAKAPATTENLNGIYTTGTISVIVGDNGALWCQSAPDTEWRALSGAGTAHLNGVYGSKASSSVWVVGANRSLYEIQF